VDADAAVLLEVHRTHRPTALVAGVLGLSTFTHLTEACDTHTRGYAPYTLDSGGRPAVLAPLVSPERSALRLADQSLGLIDAVEDDGGISRPASWLSLSPRRIRTVLASRANLFVAALPRTGMSITLYALDGCPYCEAVHDALEDHSIDYETVWVEALHSTRDEVKRVSGQRAVPVLIDDGNGVTMSESENILTYIERTLATAE